MSAASPRRGGTTPRVWWLHAAAAVLGHPGIWPTALVQLKVMAPPRWWRRFPPLPAPSPSWLAFRMETAYGDGSGRPTGEELLVFLRWCRESRRSSGRMH